MQVLCLLRKRPHESNVALTDVWFYLSNLSSVNHKFLVLFRFKSKYGCPKSSNITKLYFILNIMLPRGLKII